MTTGDHTIFVGEVLAFWLNEAPQRVLCSINDAAGYDLLLDAKRYRFGAVKA